MIEPTETIRFYCGVNETTWNHHPVQPGPYACIAPVYGRTLRTKAINRVQVPTATLVIQDSGAFSDGPGQRLSIEAAYERQLIHADTYGYAAQVTHRASYDLLIDEKWFAGQRFKARWSEQDAEDAVAETVRAAAYLAAHRQGTSAILSVQGVSTRQYLTCAQRIVPFLAAGDILGLGGFCILGKIHSLLPVFAQTMTGLLPFLRREGVSWVHLWGVCWPAALEILSWLAVQYDIKVSVDSAHPSLHPVQGQWGYGPWRVKGYVQPQVQETCRQHQFDQCNRCRGLERIRHVAATSTWLARFPVQTPVLLKRPQQLALIDWLEQHRGART
jgi:hypothetical protein